MSTTSIRNWVINVLLKLAFVSLRPSHSRFFVYCLSFVVNQVDKAWLLASDAPIGGVWIGNCISSDKRESLNDRLLESDIVVLWIPGGGFRFNLGKLYLSTFVNWIQKLEKKDIRCTILLSSYRQCPEHSFPAAMEDVTDTYNWLLTTMNIPESKIMWGADDAGAAIALDTLYHKIDKAHRPCGLLLSSPYVGLDAGGKSWQDNHGRDIITEGAVNQMERAYCPESFSMYNDDNDDDDSDILSSNKKNIGNQKPLGYLNASVNIGQHLPSKLLITVGGNEVLLDDAAWLASIIRQSGCPDTTLIQLPGQIHLSTLLGPPFTTDKAEWEHNLDHWVDFVHNTTKSGK